ncbi:MAG: flavodoxin [Armatimonadetes bacterium]|nr:flavodoxin [Armatimonadota bacterium]
MGSVTRRGIGFQPTGVSRTLPPGSWAGCPCHGPRGGGWVATRAIVVWGSTTGNTETMAKTVANGLAAEGWDVAVRECVGVSAGELADYDLVVLGSSTWGSGELQEDIAPLYEELAFTRLDGRAMAVFGPGDSSYDRFCHAVTTLEERLRRRGAWLVTESCRVDGVVEPKLPRVLAWARRLGAAAREPAPAPEDE